jgi:hypothetical protein
LKEVQDKRFSLEFRVQEYEATMEQQQKDCEEMAADL